MLITEVVNVTESYESELLLAVQDLMSMAMSKDMKKLSTVKFQAKLKDQGFVASVEEIIQAVDKSGYANSIDKDVIVPKDELADLTSDDPKDEEPEDKVDVGDMAGDQALSDIKAEL
jgi:cysteinyl-tRNA synthetase